jgi:metallophosphoesterase (TIGR00282 family)
MKIAFIGDIVGRPGRSMVKEHLLRLKKEHDIDFVIANYENASHGFGLTPKNAKELFDGGINVMTGGNHTWDKKEIKGMFDDFELLRPHNYPEGVPGTGLKIYDVCGEQLAVLNLMGYYSMPMINNPFICAKKEIEALHVKGIRNIFIDMHAEATSEKRALMMMFEGEVSAIIGTHTHVGTDDFQISKATAYLSDIGLSGCRDNVIGMDKDVPIKRFLTGMPGHFEVPKKCKRILQMAVIQIQESRCVDAYKIKTFDDGREIITEAWREV